MENNKQVAVLADTIKATRALANFYISKLESIDPHHQFTLGDHSLNSLYWITGHLAWAENYLMLRACGGTQPELSWLEFFAISRPHNESASGPSWEDVKKGYALVHEATMNHLASMTDDQLDNDNHLGNKFMGSMAIRNAIMHHIRHEGTHCGHLGWMAKLHGIKTI